MATTVVTPPKKTPPNQPRLTRQQTAIMPPPTPLSIKTSSVLRLIKEEASYHEETIQQKAAVEKLELEGADEYDLRQPVRHFPIFVSIHIRDRICANDYLCSRYYDRGKSLNRLL